MDAALTFRTANENDIPLIRSLATTIWNAHYPGIVSQAQIDYMLEKMYARETIIRELAEGFVYHIAVTDEPAGYMEYRYTAEDCVLTLSKIYLLPKEHGKGYGRTMLTFALDRAKEHGAKIIRLAVNKKNATALRAYERFGFVRTESVETPFGNGYIMDDYIMTYRIEEQ